MKPSFKLKLFLWYFSRFKVPMLGFVKPQLIHIDNQTVIVKIALKRRSRNHIHSMYFGALAAGADLAAGLHAVYLAHNMRLRVTPIFKSLHAEFLKRAEQDVYFICEEGQKVAQMLSKAQSTQQRVTHSVTVQAVIGYPHNKITVAAFELGLSIKLPK